jgi:hypothetical protein
MLNHRKLVALWSTILLFSIIVSCLPVCSAQQSIAPPIAKIVPKADTLFGDVRIDNYFWLRTKAKPEVREIFGGGKWLY